MEMGVEMETVMQIETWRRTREASISPSPSPEYGGSYVEDMRPVSNSVSSFLSAPRPHLLASVASSRSRAPGTLVWLHAVQLLTLGLTVPGDTLRGPEVDAGEARKGMRRAGGREARRRLDKVDKVWDGCRRIVPRDHINLSHFSPFWGRVSCR